jgi:hypothetical protein
MANLPRIHNGVIAWWLIDADDDVSHVGPLPDHGHETCLHRSYRLTCKEYEYLLRRSSGCCETCGLPGPENYHRPRYDHIGKLYIDHQPGLGMWAVRGLLCRDCNSRIRFPWFGVRGERYLADAWYLGRLRRAGISPGHWPTEPPPGARVRDHTYRTWTHTKRGWIPNTYQRRTGRRSWHDLNYRYGPHNLHVIEPGGDVA